MVQSVTTELETLKLGDRRLEARGKSLIGELAEDPSVLPPNVLCEAELEAFYRYVNNLSVTLPALLSPHADATVARASALARVIVAHDTTDFRFSDEVEREGLGPMDNGGQGFYGQFSLAVSSERHALGVLAVETWTRKSRTSSKVTQEERYADPNKESLRWMRGVRASQEKLGDGRRVIHVADRETDDYDILSELVEGDFGFVVRACYDRRLVLNADDAAGTKMKAFARDLAIVGTREAELSRRGQKRPPKQRKRFPPREGRTTSLTFSAGQVTLRRPKLSKAKLEEITLNLVHVYEPAPPEGCEPVEWFLYTREPIDTEEDVLRVVDDYRCRWVVEEFFRALKTGCAFEKRQHESKHALLNALGLFIPIAWSLLNMRTLSRDPSTAERPAEEVFTPTQLLALRARAKQKWPENPTVRQAVLLMSRLLGGWLPSNGEPGWIVLGRAYDELLIMEHTWNEAIAFLDKSRERSDR